MKLKTSLFSICLLILSLQSLQAQTVREISEDIAKSRRYIMDYAGIFSEEAERLTTDSLIRFEKRTGNQIVVLTLKQIPENEDVFTFSMRLADTLKIGQEKEDNGVFVIITTEGKRQFKIYPGRGLEGALPDVVINRFFRDDAVPKLKAGLFDEVLVRTIYFICASTEGEYKAPAKKAKGELSLSDFLVGGLILLVLFLVLSNISKRNNNGGNNLGGGSRKTRTSDTAAWPFLLPLIFGGGGHSGGSGWGGGSSGGGFGGFSGGGGSFGGGGGGGSW